MIRCEDLRTNWDKGLFARNRPSRVRGPIEGSEKDRADREVLSLGDHRRVARKSFRPTRAEEMLQPAADASGTKIEVFQLLMRLIYSYVL